MAKKIIAFLKLIGFARVITVLGGYPYPEREKDGYFQRIKKIDDVLFLGKRRIYIDRALSMPEDKWLDQPAPDTFVIRVGKTQRNKVLARIFMLFAFLRSRTIYIHSIYPLRGLGFIMLIPWAKKTLDMHGVAPEELFYYGEAKDSEAYERIEEYAVQKATSLVFVSASMRQHFERKYPEVTKKKTSLLPVFPEIPSEYFEKTYLDGKPLVVYAGGLQKWQQVPMMIDAIHETHSRMNYSFFCPKPDVFEKKLLDDGLIFSPNLIVDSKSRDELLQIYRDCHYGFILREAHLINRVACPTKLVEYLATGIIPVVDYDDIGDFKALGMQFVQIKDFVQGRVPDEKKRNKMAAQNLKVYHCLQRQYSQGIEALKELIL